MLKPRTKSRRKDQIGWSKVLTAKEQQLFWTYLHGESPSKITGEPIDLESVATIRFQLISDLLFRTGLRETELAQLRVCDTPLVLGTNVIEVYRGKNNKDRTIQISQRLADSLGEYVKQFRPKTMPRHIRRSDITRPVFYSQGRRPYLQKVRVVSKGTGEITTRLRTSVSLYRKFRITGRHAGIAKRVFPHMLRHTFAVNALLNGVDIYLLQQLMGHSDITITARYLHIVNAQLAGLGEKLDRSFRGSLEA